MPGGLFFEVFGNYVPRLCIDTAVIGPTDTVELVSWQGFTPVFSWSGSYGIALRERHEAPRMGQWGLPGGTMFKGEQPEDAAKRIIKADLGLEIEVLGSIGYMYFPNEHRTIEVDGITRELVIDSISLVLIAQAREAKIVSPKTKAGWFRRPPVRHEYHTPFLETRGLLVP